MENILLDFTGGLFSVLQTLVNLANNDSPKINPIKFTLGNVSMAFDILFMIQHFMLYKDHRHVQVARNDSDGDNRPARQYVNFNNDDYTA